MSGLEHLFIDPENPKQRRYEAIRAIELDGLSVVKAAKKFGYTKATLYTYIRNIKEGKLELFPTISRVAQKRQTPKHVQKRIMVFRKQNLSVLDIEEKLKGEGYKISARTIERILVGAGFSRLKRRTKAELGLTRKEQFIPKKAIAVNFKTLKPFTIDCPIAGVFFFIPYIIESGILDIVNQCQLPKSSVIDAKQASLSMLLLKLVGGERLSHISDYSHEPGLGLFAGLTVLPKSTYMLTYSCRTSEQMLQELQEKLLKKFTNTYSDFYRSNFVNLDFHSIPHYGTESQMEQVWCGAKHQVLKGANTILAQDSESNVILYTKADILRKNETKEIKIFVDYWKKIKNTLEETLVFDCRLTSYQVLDELNTEGIKFITLRKRNKKLISTTEKLDPKLWQKVFIPIPKRKHKRCSIYESNVVLKKGQAPVRQIIVKDHGRSTPTYIITNNRTLKTDKILFIYAKRWRIENKISELISFFNLNALSSPIMVRIHFDILWTVIADTLYHRLILDLPRFEHENAKAIFRKFINMPGKISYDGENFILKIRKRAHTPILMKIQKLSQEFCIPWLENRKLKIVWTA